MKLLNLELKPSKLINKLTPILEEYSKKIRSELLFKKNILLWEKKEDDITKDIMKIVNQKLKVSK